MADEYRELHVIRSLGQTFRELLMWGLWDLHSCPAALKPPSSCKIPAPHATAPAFPEVPAEAVTVGPSAGNFLWSAGSNLTWGLDSTERSVSAHPQTAPLSLLPSPLQYQTSATAEEEHH